MAETNSRLLWDGMMDGFVLWMWSLYAWRTKRGKRQSFISWMFCCILHLVYFLIFFYFITFAASNVCSFNFAVAEIIERLIRSISPTVLKVSWLKGVSSYSLFFVLLNREVIMFTCLQLSLCKVAGFFLMSLMIGVVHLQGLETVGDVYRAKMSGVLPENSCESIFFIHYFTCPIWYHDHVISWSPTQLNFAT